ncbi:hypothetical protein DB330_08355 [Lacticaseibacillus casei]|uniref:Uncharacterized protein n=1 Tax=Lacticaseibacillus casei TaxID=1582 RepID=A0AAN1F197_LACCA|nr:hypothetical protein BGL52_14540 [Lacticaseibacillus casei]KAB1970056.1 hypothetical protein F9B82_06780 [Lacticaseibacillus casei]MED7631002.1 hypothetical protein [Lacticaseibacillus casei]PTU94052.1 hypothetical protein DB330_08355 [Lacticaseibacillus casei]PTU95472.1 hypothetical protein DB326_08425 [Lacticaseibacillus casei]
MPKHLRQFLLTYNADLRMRPLTYCFLNTCLFALYFIAFMSILISYEALWSISIVIFICLLNFLINIISVVSQANNAALSSLFKTRRRWLIQFIGTALVSVALFSLGLLTKL